MALSVYAQNNSGPDAPTDVTGTIIGSKTALDTRVLSGSITGTFTQSGLFTDFVTTTQDVTSTASKLPATPLTDRNSISIFNTSATDTLYIGKSTVTADRSLGTTAGWEVGPNEGFNLDITDAIELWGRAETGKTIRVKILELA